MSGSLDQVHWMNETNTLPMSAHNIGESYDIFSTPITPPLIPRRKLSSLSKQKSSPHTLIMSADDAIAALGNEDALHKTPSRKRPPTALAPKTPAKRKPAQQKKAVGAPSSSPADKIVKRAIDFTTTDGFPEAADMKEFADHIKASDEHMSKSISFDCNVMKGALTDKHVYVYTPNVEKILQYIFNECNYEPKMDEFNGNQYFKVSFGDFAKNHKTAIETLKKSSIGSRSKMTIEVKPYKMSDSMGFYLSLSAYETIQDKQIIRKKKKQQETDAEDDDFDELDI